MGFLGVNFWSRDLFGFCCKSWGFFWVSFLPPVRSSRHLKSGVPLLGFILLRTFHSHSEHAGKICSFSRHLRLYHQSLYRVAKKEGKLYMFSVFACARNKLDKASQGLLKGTSTGLLTMIFKGTPFLEQNRFFFLQPLKPITNILQANLSLIPLYGTFTSKT